jgi:hypothetical protein
LGWRSLLSYGAALVRTLKRDIKADTACTGPALGRLRALATTRRPPLSLADLDAAAALSRSWSGKTVALPSGTDLAAAARAVRAAPGPSRVGQLLHLRRLALATGADGGDDGGDDGDHGQATAVGKQPRSRSTTPLRRSA